VSSSLIPRFSIGAFMFRRSLITRNRDHTSDVAVVSPDFCLPFVYCQADPKDVAASGWKFDGLYVVRIA